MASPQHERMAEPSQAFPCPRCKVPVVATAVSGSSAKCPACGVALHFKSLTAEVLVSGHLFRRARHPGTKANYDVQLEDGSSFHRKSLRWHRLTRIIDRLHDRYYEHVTDAETGSVVRHIDERLSDHR